MAASNVQRGVELILQQLEELPTLPGVAVRLMQAVQDGRSSAADVARIISADPALTTRLLSLLHRAENGAAAQITSVERAVVLLGFDAVRAMTLAVAVFQTLPPTNQPPTETGYSRTAVWTHSLAVACAAELLAAETPDLDPGEAFVAGLLHDLGKIALDATVPKSFGRIVEAADVLRGNIADVERSVIGLDHMVVGKRLAERWQLPTTIAECAWLHGQSPAALPATVRNAKLVNLITLADGLVRERHLGYSGNYATTPTRDELAAALGLKESTIDSAMRDLAAAITPRAEALGLSDLAGDDLYQQAVGQAHRELGRVSTQLAMKNRKLAVRAKFFDALAQFQGELRPDAPPQVVLHAVAQTAVTVLTTGRAAAFSLPPGEAFAEVIVVDGNGDVIDSTVIDGATRPTKPTGVGPILPAGQDLEWLLAAVSPRLTHDGRHWIALEADGVCIGGVIWGAAAGESQRLAHQLAELAAVAAGWSLALRTTQIRDEAKRLAEQLAETNRRLQSAQSDLLRAKTLATVGEMAAGAAHEMNNPLAVIAGRSQLLAMTLSDEKQRAAARLVFEQSHKVTDIITELMAFAKPTPPLRTVTSVAELLTLAIAAVQPRVDSADRKIEQAIGELPAVWVDRDQVAEALAEVMENAFQATATDGKIRLSAAFDPSSSQVAVVVTDDGRGMDAATQSHAFDPFFSAHAAGRRRGLGLAKALRWVEASGGSMRIESEIGRGTRVLLLLPEAVAIEVPAAGNRELG